MPTYEMPLLLRVMKKPETATALKRVANAIFDKGGFIRKIENLGQRSLPYKMSVHDVCHKQASYFLFHFDFPPVNTRMMMEDLNRDLDVIRNRIYEAPNKNSVTQQCTWHEEMLPPPYRPDVQQLMKVSDETKKKKKKQFEFNSGLDYYPFQR